MKNLIKGMMFASVMTVVASAQAWEYDNQVFNFSFQNSITANPSVPLRYAKARVRVIKSTFRNDPSNPGFVETDICIADIPQVPVYQVPFGGNLVSPVLGKVECRDTINNSVSTVQTLIVFTQGKLIDTFENIKAAVGVISTVWHTPNQPVAQFRNESSSSFTKDLFLKSFIVSAHPTAGWACTSVNGTPQCATNLPEYYSALIDIED